MSFNKSLVILAAGMGSRYNGPKQTDGIGPNGEFLMEYAIYDALKAGFDKVVCVVNEQFRLELQTYLQKRFLKQVELIFVVQNTRSCVRDEWLDLVCDRRKPWGTAQAVLVASQVINEPFMVINADDYYGPQAFAYAASRMDYGSISNSQYAMVAYPIGQTLSEYGAVSRGICTVAADGLLIQVTEQTHIEKRGNQIVYTKDKVCEIVDPNTWVSMNCWIFHPSIFSFLQTQFDAFLQLSFRDPKTEFFLPIVVNDLVKSQKVSVHVGQAGQLWFGLTYAADKAAAKEYIKDKISKGIYPHKMWF